MPMKPAFFINDLHKGGAERLVKDLVFEMVEESDVDPLVIVARNEGVLRSEVEDGGIPVHSLNANVSPAGIPGAVRSLSSTISSVDVDLVHSHLPFSHVVSRLACARHSINHVSTYHNIREHKTLPRGLAERWTRPLSNRTVCVSDGVRQSYPNSADMEVIYNAIDVEGFNERVSESTRPDLPDKAETASTIFLNVARCVEQKRQQDLIEAATHLDSTRAHLVIVGDGPRRERLEELMTEQGVEETVSVLGYVEKIEPYYKIADVFISASSNEGLPTTHIEAMAARLPIISTKIPGVTEIVEHGENGLLCPVGKPAVLANAIQSMQDNNRTRYGERGYEMAKSTFTLERIASEHLEMYREVLESREA